MTTNESTVKGTDYPAWITPDRLKRNRIVVAEVIDDRPVNHETSLLSQTHDMACYSWSLPAGYSCPMAVYGYGAICSHCYATLNRYLMPNVMRAQWLRFVWLRFALKNNVNVFVSTMVDAISSHCVTVPYFRWHDSGDLFSVSYVRAVIAVCKRTPNVKHWFPTRSWQVNGGKAHRLHSNWHKALLELASLQNVSVRSSAIRFDESAPSTPYGHGSAAYTDADGVNNGIVVLDNVVHKACPKSIKHGGTCASENCRSCWDDDEHVAYLVHGWRGRNVPGTMSADSARARDVARDRYMSMNIYGISSRSSVLINELMVHFYE